MLLATLHLHLYFELYSLSYMSNRLESRNKHLIPRKQTSASTVEIEALKEDSKLLKNMMSSEEASADLNDPCAQEDEVNLNN